MRKLFALLTAGMLLLGMTGCRNETTHADTGIDIVCTVFPQYDFARTIGGEYVNATLLLAAGQEMHNYEPSPLDVAEIAGCDLFLRIGGESEVWTDTLLDALDTADMQVVTLMDAIGNPLDHEHDHCTEEHDHAHEDAAHEEAHFDEHIWNSPVNAIVMVQTVCDALCQADPAHADIFVSRTNDYIAALSELDAQYRGLAASCDEPVLIVADKFPFRYLAAEYGFDYSAAFSGCSSETEPTADSLLTLIEETQKHGSPTVFYLEFSSRKIADRVCEITGAEAVMLRPGHNVSAEDMENGITFLTLMQANYEVIKEALT